MSDWTRWLIRRMWRGEQFPEKWNRMYKKSGGEQKTEHITGVGIRPHSGRADIAQYNKYLLNYFSLQWVLLIFTWEYSVMRMIIICRTFYNIPGTVLSIIHTLAYLIFQIILLWYYHLNFKIMKPDSDTVSRLS